MKRSQIIPFVALQILTLVMAVLALTLKTSIWYFAAYGSVLLLLIYVAVIAYQSFFPSE